MFIIFPITYSIYILPPSRLNSSWTQNTSHQFLCCFFLSQCQF
jgi:hypothetical protein